MWILKALFLLAVRWLFPPGRKKRMFRRQLFVAGGTFSFIEYLAKFLFGFEGCAHGVRGRMGFVGLGVDFDFRSVAMVAVPPKMTGIYRTFQIGRGHINFTSEVYYSRTAVFYE